MWNRFCWIRGHQIRVRIHGMTAGIEMGPGEFMEAEIRNSLR